MEKELFGYSAEVFDNFLLSNDSIPKGTFQIKKRGSGYYWYYTLSTNTTGRVKFSGYDLLPSDVLWKFD